MYSFFARELLADRPIFHHTNSTTSMSILDEFDVPGVVPTQQQQQQQQQQQPPPPPPLQHYSSLQPPFQPPPSDTQLHLVASVLAIVLNTQLVAPLPNLQQFQRLQLVESVKTQLRAAATSSTATPLTTSMTEQAIVDSIMQLLDNRRANGQACYCGGSMTHSPSDHFKTPRHVRFCQDQRLLCACDRTAASPKLAQDKSACFCGKCGGLFEVCSDSSHSTTCVNSRQKLAWCNQRTATPFAVHVGGMLNNNGKRTGVNRRGGGGGRSIKLKSAIHSSSNNNNNNDDDDDYDDDSDGSGCDSGKRRRTVEPSAQAVGSDQSTSIVHRPLFSLEPSPFTPSLATPLRSPGSAFAQPLHSSDGAGIVPLCSSGSLPPSLLFD